MQAITIKKICVDFYSASLTSLCRVWGWLSQEWIRGCPLLQVPLSLWLTSIYLYSSSAISQIHSCIKTVVRVSTNILMYKDICVYLCLCCVYVAVLVYVRYAAAYAVYVWLRSALSTQNSFHEGLHVGVDILLKIDTEVLLARAYCLCPQRMVSLLCVWWWATQVKPSLPVYTGTCLCCYRRYCGYKYT